MNHPCDRRTDGIAIAYAHLAYMLSRANNQMEPTFSFLHILNLCTMHTTRDAIPLCDAGLSTTISCDGQLVTEGPAMLLQL